jgi:hypothetical protein
VKPKGIERVDARAKALGVSRNRFIVQALEESLGVWSPEVVRLLTTHPVSAAASHELGKAMAHVLERRTRKARPPKL